jgi:WD40 repeat protein
MQIDANSDGGIDWNEFSNYMLMESQANQTEITENVSNFFLSEKLGSNSKRSEGDWHVSSTSCIAIDNHNNCYITAAKERSIRLWCMSTGSIVKVVQSPDWVYAMSLVGGKLLCTTCADRRIRLYDLHQWDHVREVECPCPAVCLCTWRSKDEDLLAYGDDKGRVTVANLSRDFEKTKGDTRKLEKARTGSWLEYKTKHVHDGWVHQVSMVPDLGCLVSCGSDSAISIFEFPFRLNPRARHRILPKRVLRHSRGHTKGVKCFVWVRSQKVLISGGLEHAIVVWNPYTGKPISSLSGHQLGIERLDLVPDFDKLVSLSADGCIKVWDLLRSECVQSINPSNSFTRPTALVYDAARTRLVGSSRRPCGWRVNPRVLLPTSETTHRSAVVAALFNRTHGQLVTVAEDTETVIWRVASGQRIFSFFDTEREVDSPLSCAEFDEAGRRLITGDHQGLVKVWNFNNGGCLRVLAKAPSRNREEVTALASYVYEGSRFVAATGWDRRIWVWADDADTEGDEVLMSVEAHAADVVSAVFTRPKNLVTTALDGAVSVFDTESGARRATVTYGRPGGSGGGGRAPAEAVGHADGDFLDAAQTPYVERMRVLERKGDTLVSVGSDGNLCFWEGVSLRLVLAVPARHRRRFGLVGLQTDKWNRFLVTADQGGYVRLWDIAGYIPATPSAAQVVPLALWRAHASAVTALDLVPFPSPGENLSDFMAGHETSSYVVVTGSRDRRVLVWSCDGACVGRLGQAAEWSLADRSTWVAARSAAVLGADDDETDDSTEEDVVAREEPSPAAVAVAAAEEEEVDILQLLDERLRPRRAVQGLPPVALSEPPNGAWRASRREYRVDQVTGDRVPVQQETEKRRSTAADERRRAMSPYLKAFSKRVDPDSAAP